MPSRCFKQPVGGFTTVALNLGALLVSSLALSAQPPLAYGQQPSGQSEAPTLNRPSGSIVVAPERLKVSLTIKGVLTATEQFPISVDPERVSEVVVAEAVGHGCSVTSGQVILRLQTKKIDRQIESLKRSIALQKVELAQAKQSADLQRQSRALKLASARRSHKIAREDLQRFLKVDRPLQTKQAEYQLKVARQRLDYAQEELKQLEAMYKEDDLTEETEEIILKRQLNSVENAKFSVEQAEVSREESLETEIPRREVTLQQAARQASLTLEETEIQTQIEARRQELELSRLQAELDLKEEELAELQADRNQLILKAPTSGLVYYGECLRGKWPSLATMQGKLRPGGRLKPPVIAMTVVKTRPLMIEGTVQEEHLAQLKPGQTGVALPQGDSRAFSVQVQEISPVPVAEGTFAVKLSLELPEDIGPPLVPGRHCQITLPVCNRDDAVVVPASVINREAIPPTVTLWTEKGTQTVPVKLGLVDGNRLEITQGVQPGDVVIPQGTKPDSEEPKTSQTE